MFDDSSGYKDGYVSRMRRITQPNVPDKQLSMNSIPVLGTPQSSDSQGVSNDSSSCHSAAQSRLPSASSGSSNQSRSGQTGFTEFWYQTVHKATSVENFASKTFKPEWSARPWLEWRRLYEYGYINALVANNQAEQNYMRCKCKGMRVTAMLHTLRSLKERNYLCQSNQQQPIWISLIDSNTGIHYRTPPPMPPLTQTPDTMVSVVLGDGIRKCRDVAESGFNPAVIVFASDTQIGGGYKTGEYGDEEDLIRRSNILEFYSTFEENYPLDDFSVIYCSDVMIFRGPEYTGFEYEVSPYQVDVILVPHYVKPQGLEAANAQAHYLSYVRRKLERAAIVALANGHDSLVIQPLGNGKDVPLDWLSTVLKSVFEQFSTQLALVVVAIQEGAETGNIPANNDGAATSPFHRPLSVDVSNQSESLLPGLPLKRAFDKLHSVLHGMDPGAGIDLAHYWYVATKKLCPKQGHCPQAHITGHAEAMAHPPPCPKGRNCLHLNVLEHTYLFTHVGCTPSCLSDPNARMGFPESFLSSVVITSPTIETNNNKPNTKPPTKAAKSDSAQPQPQPVSVHLVVPPKPSGPVMDDLDEMEAQLKAISPRVDELNVNPTDDLDIAENELAKIGLSPTHSTNDILQEINSRSTEIAQNGATQEEPTLDEQLRQWEEELGVS